MDFFGDIRSQETNIRGDVLWVYQALGGTSEPPPSPGAYALLQWVQVSTANKNTFYSQMFPKFAPKDDNNGNKDPMYDDGRNIKKVLTKVLKHIEAHG